MPVSNSDASIDGAPSAYTDDGPPERITAAGLRATMSSTDIVCGTISLYTSASRTRRAISWAYCAPKSTTSTVGPVGSLTEPPLHLGDRALILEGRLCVGSAVRE